MTDIKKCNRCKNEKPLTEYYVRESTSKPYALCMICTNNARERIRTSKSQVKIVEQCAPQDQIISAQINEQSAIINV